MTVAVALAVSSRDSSRDLEIAHDDAFTVGARDVLERGELRDEVVICEGPSADHAEHSTDSALRRFAPGPHDSVPGAVAVRCVQALEVQHEHALLHGSTSPSSWFLPQEAGRISPPGLLS